MMILVLFHGPTCITETCDMLLLTGGFSLDSRSSGVLALFFVSYNLGYIHSGSNSSNPLETDILLPHSHIPS